MIEQMPAWMGHPFFVIVFGVLLVVGAFNVVSAIVDFTTWLHLAWSAISLALFVWIFLLTLGVWRRERRRRASRSDM